MTTPLQQCVILGARVDARTQPTASSVGRKPVNHARGGGQYARRRATTIPISNGPEHRRSGNPERDAVSVDTATIGITGPNASLRPRPRTLRLRSRGLRKDSGWHLWRDG